MTTKTTFYSDPAAPPATPPVGDDIPLSLRELPQWVSWRFIWSEAKASWAKVPISAVSPNPADATDPKNWQTFAAALARVRQRKAHGLGFAIANGFVGIDLDDCRDPATGDLNPFALEVLEKFKTYTEVSPSATGVKLIGKGAFDFAGKKKLKPQLGVELFAAGSGYFTVTAQRVPGTPAEVLDLQPAIDAHMHLLMGATTRKGGEACPRSPTTAPLPSVDAIKARVLSHPEGRAWMNGEAGDDHSAADLGLCNLITFFAGPHPDLIDAVFRTSALFRPSKWSEKHAADGRTYGTLTIEKALAGRREFFTWNPQRVKVGTSPPPKGAPTPPTRRVPEYLPFPEDALPVAMRNVVLGVAGAVGCDPAYAALPALTLAGACIGGALVVSPKRKFREPPTLFSLVVGDSGTAKSPAAAPFAEMAAEIEDTLEERYAEACRCRQEAALSGEKTDKQEPEPVRDYFLAEDVTIERLIENLSTSPRGLLNWHDEAAGWFASFTRYKGSAGGSDAAKWLSMFDAKGISYQRKLGPVRDIRVPRAVVSVFGGIQPDILRTVLNDPSYIASGLAGRIIFAAPPKKCPRWTEAELDPDAEAAFSNVLADLRAIPFDGKRPGLVTLEPDAKKVFVRFSDDLMEQAENEDGGPLAAALPKLARISLRLALVHHGVLVAAAGENPGSYPVSQSSMEAGVSLARWFACEGGRVYAMFAESGEERDARRLAELVQRKGGRITASQLCNASGRRYPTADAAHLALEVLVSAGYGTWAPQPSGPTGGRPTEVFVLRPMPDGTSPKA